MGGRRMVIRQMEARTASRRGGVHKGRWRKSNQTGAGGNQTLRAHPTPKSLRSHPFTIDDGRGPPVFSERRQPTTQARSDGG